MRACVRAYVSACVRVFVRESEQASESVCVLSCVHVHVCVCAKQHLFSKRGVSIRPVRLRICFEPGTRFP